MISMVFLGYLLLLVLVKHQTLLYAVRCNNDGCWRDDHFLSLGGASDTNSVLMCSSPEYGIVTIMLGAELFQEGCPTNMINEPFDKKTLVFQPLKVHPTSNDEIVFWKSILGILFIVDC